MPIKIADTTIESKARPTGHAERRYALEEGAGEISFVADERENDVWVYSLTVPRCTIRGSIVATGTDAEKMATLTATMKSFVAPALACCGATIDKVSE